MELALDQTPASAEKGYERHPVDTKPSTCFYEKKVDQKAETENLENSE